MAITLTTSRQALGHTQTVGEGSLYYYFYARYENIDGSPTQKKVIVEVTAYGTAGGRASSSGSTFNCTLNGTTKSATGCSFTWPSWGESGVSGTITFTVDYDTSTGTWSNKSISCSISGGSGSWSSGGGIGNCSSRSNVTNTVSLPNIDPSPSASISSVTINSAGYNDNIVAGYTLLTVNMSITKVRTASLKWEGAGVTTTKTLSPTYSTSASTLTYNLTTPVPASASNYSLKFTLTYGNNTASSTATKSVSVKGYVLPVLGTGSYTVRCEGSGKSSPNGSFGKVYLDTCVVTPITTSNPNIMTYYSTQIDTGNGYVSGTSADLTYKHGMKPTVTSSGTTIKFTVGTNFTSEDLSYFNGSDSTSGMSGTKLWFDNTTDGGNSLGTRYVTNVTTTTVNHVTTVTVTVNSSISVTAGTTYVSIPVRYDGSLTSSPYYRWYIFPLNPTSQADVKVTLRDTFGDSLSPKVSNVNHLAVSKSIMALSLYQEGDAVGIAVGRMATEAGLWCYESFYLKSSTQGSVKIFHIQVDDSGNITASEV